MQEILINFNDIFKQNDIKIQYNIDQFAIETDLAMYFGLLLTELCINSLKHAFKGQNNKQIDFKLIHSKTQIEFEYRDNGIHDFDNDVKPKLIDKLCRQIKVNYTIDSDRGFKFSFKKQIA